MELTIQERVKLLEILPAQGDLLTLKILRKLRETLSFSEEELTKFGTRYEYVCPSRIETDEGLVFCTNRGWFPKLPVPKCGEHNIEMVQTGQMNLLVPPESVSLVKEIHMGLQAVSIASNALKHLNDTKQLTEDLVGLYEKFFPPEEKTEE